MRTVTGGLGRHILSVLVTTMSLAVFLSCSSSSKNTAATGKSVIATDEQIFIGDTVEKNYDPNVIMKRAESFFDKEEYAEAIIEYQHFLDLHRVHTLASYAQFKIAESNFKMAKTVDRDMDPVRKALEGYEKLLKDYPGNKWQNDARDRIRACNDLLAQAAYFVGKFYQRREAYLAAAKRFEGIVKHYPEMEVASDAMFDLAATYHEIGADDWAQEKLLALEQQYPNHKHKTESQKLYAALKTTAPSTAIAKATAPAPTSPPTLAASNAPVALGAIETVPAISQSALTASAATPSSLSNGDATPTFSDGLYRPGSPPARPASAPAMTLASAKAVLPAAISAPTAISVAPTIIDGAAIGPVTICRLGAWC